MGDETGYPDHEPLLSSYTRSIPSSVTVMAESSRVLRALQRIADTARKINPSLRSSAAVQATPNVLTSLPEHRPLLPLLLSYDIPSKIAKACADRYDGYASRLRSAAENKLAPYLINRSKSQPARVYSIFLGEYKQTLRIWSQSILNAALKSLKRDSVELQNWDVTHPAPLWLPLPPDPAFTRKTMEKSCPLSSISRPSHAFPTTYPPPLRPTSVVSSVEWLRAPVASSTPRSTLVVDLDSLCSHFATSLIIDESPRPPQQPKTSIFFLPVITKEPNVGHTPQKFTKRKHSRPEVSNKLSTTKPSIPSLNTAKPRRLSVPPLPSTSPKTKPTPRKASAPARVPSSRPASASPRPSTSTRRTAATTSVPSLNTRTSGERDTYSYPGPSIPLYSPPSFQSTLDQSTHTPQDPPSTGPTTPTFLPDLFSEPIIVSSTPVHLSPGSSLMPITDPFLQFPPQYDYFSGPYTVPTFDYGGFEPVLTTGGNHFSKSALDVPPGFGHLRGIPALMASDSSENTFFNIHTLS